MLLYNMIVVLFLANEEANHALSLLFISIAISILDYLTISLQSVTKIPYRVRVLFNLIGWYSSWTYDVKNNTNDEYCGYTPYMYSFVMLILAWCTLPFLIFCSCAALFCSKWENFWEDEFLSTKPNSKLTSLHHKISNIIII